MGTLCFTLVSFLSSEAHKKTDTELQKAVSTSNLEANCCRVTAGC